MTMTEIFVRSVLPALVVAAVVALWRLYLWPLPQKIRDHQEQLIDRVVKKAIEPIKAELHPNGGSSLRDAIDRLNSGQSAIAQALTIFDHQNRAMLGFHEESRGWFFTDAEGNLTWMSSQVLRWVGRQLSDVIGDRWRSIICPDLRDASFRWWRETCSTGSYGEMEQAYIASDGSRIRVQIYASPVFDDETRKLLCYVGTITRLDPEIKS